VSASLNLAGYLPQNKSDESKRYHGGGGGGVLCSRVFSRRRLLNEAEKIAAANKAQGACLFCALY
jgi:hypothetical protein